MESREFGRLVGPFIKPVQDKAVTHVMILLHGWGSDGNDLAGLAQPFAVNFPSMAFFAPNGPNPCKVNPMGREWFDIDDRVNGPDYAAPIIEGAIDSVLEGLELSANRLILAGFSQGAMMSLHCGLRMKQPPAAIVSFSGALLRHDDLAKNLSRPYPPVQLIHGTEDDVLPVYLMKEAGTVLKKLGINFEMVERPGLSHGIDAESITASINFLEPLISQ